MALERVQASVVYQENIYLISQESSGSRYRSGANPMAIACCLAIFGAMAITAGIYTFTNKSNCDGYSYCENNYTAAGSVLTVCGGISELGSAAICAAKYFRNR